MTIERHKARQTRGARWARPAATVILGLLCVVMALAGTATGVSAATINAVTLSGGVVVDGTRYARTTAPPTSLMVSVATSVGTNCVTISGGVATETLIDVVGRTNWVFSPNATGANEAVRTITVTAYENWNVIQGCTSAAPTSSVSYTVDNAAPTTTAALSGTQVAGVYQDSATVTLTATDALSGVGSTTYTVDGGPATPYSGPITVDTGGAHTVTYWSADRLANTEATKVVSFTIDNNHLALGPLADRTFGDPDFTVAATSNSSGPIAYSAAGSCTLALALASATVSAAVAAAAALPSIQTIESGLRIVVSFVGSTRRVSGSRRLARRRC